MSEFKKFRVVPVLPDRLFNLSEIAKNLWYCWNHDAFKLFQKIDEDLWHSSNHNPVKVLEESEQRRLDELSGDKNYLDLLDKVYKKFKSYTSLAKDNDNMGYKVGYFSAEFGITEALPIYSGGLGILSGDHIKSASDLNIALIGVGLMYQEGYFQQRLDKNGWQQDFYRVNDFNTLPVNEVYKEDGEILTVNVKIGDRDVTLKVWRITVGRINIFMLDSNIDSNKEEDKKLTAHLYGGDREFRLKQEIALGIGGMKVFQELGIEPDVIHINEGHSAFAIFERANFLKNKYSISIEEALELSKKSSVFTTHTPVAAGNDEFSDDLIRKYFSRFSESLGISIDDFMELGKDPGNRGVQKFSMTVAAIKNSSYINAVSKLHGEVARKMWNHLWKGIPEEHTPIQSITNGIHISSWISGEMKELLDRYVGEGWEFDKSKTSFNRIKDVGSEELWKVKLARTEKLIGFVRKKVSYQYREKEIFNISKKEIEKILDPNALTVGFARRFASYKRGDLIFRDPERLKKILFDKDRPVQLIIAGKAHPQDNPGKEIIKRITEFINSNGMGTRIVFLENYDINIARYLVQGVDLWLNNPIRMFEASGTSGMKVVVNGGLNLSVLDGWWDEGFDMSNGWAIGSRTSINDPEYRDDVESDSIYSVLEDEIKPLFFDRNEKGIPVGWMEKVKNSMISLAPIFNTFRMVSEYNEKFYVKASKNYSKLKKDDFSGLKEFVEWKKNIIKEFNKVGILEIKYEKDKNFKIGENFEVSVIINSSSIKDEDLKVEIYYGKLEQGDKLTGSMLTELLPELRTSEGNIIYRGKVFCKISGNIGFKVRVTPKHKYMVDSLELNLVKWM